MIVRTQRHNQTHFKKNIYSDVTPNLDIAETTGLLVKLTNEDAIKQSIRNLILTYPTERFYHPEIGTPASRALFELNGLPTDFIADQLHDQISYTLSAFEPRVTNIQVSVNSHPTGNYIDVEIQFSIINIPNQSFTVKFPIRVR